jgi:thymidylate synthase ThyX
MGYSCKILKDSITERGCRLTTMEVTFPRIVLAEFNTHRMFSRNSASSRAIPVAKMLARVKEDPFFPIYWGKNQKGMQASEELSPEAKAMARENWRLARDVAVSVVSRLQEEDIDLHKQIANRLLEPFLWHTVIVTATDWGNFFALRAHKDAMPEIRRIAEMMREAYEDPHRKPSQAAQGYWHLPLVYDDAGQPRFPDDIKDAEAIQKENDVPWLQTLVKVSCGRCARVSYLTHDGKRSIQDDIQLYDRLRTSGHMSPLEHAARPMSDAEWKASAYSGNFRGWVQHRKEIPNEGVFQPV